MMIKKEYKVNNFTRYMRKTFKNKVCALVLLIAGMIPVWIDGDGTALLFFGCIAVPMFLAKDNWINI